MHDNLIYLETDEDITSAIDKLTKAPGKAVQIVMPKRATLLQSLINQKLIKKAAENNGKQLTVVTSDRVVTNLASRTGIAVAARVGQEGEVPSAAPTPALASDEIDGGAVETAAPKVAPAVAAPLSAPEPEPTPAPEPRTEVAPPQPVPAQPKVQHAPLAAAQPISKPSGKVPNLSTLQKRIAIGAAAVLAIIGLLILNTLLTSASLTMYAKATRTPVNFSFAASPEATTSDNSLKATKLSNDKTLNASVPATGKKDAGTKASGTITVSNSYDTAQHPLVAGTRFVAADGKVFRSTADATVPGAQLTLVGGNPVIKPGTTTVNVESDVASDQYNIGPTDYTIPGLPADQRSKITGRGGQMQGGTTKTLTIVTQGDIDKAKQSALDADKEGAEKSLTEKAGKDATILPGSFAATVGSVSSSVNANAEATQVQVSVQVSYSLLTVLTSELKELVRSQAQQEAGDNNQVYDDGADKVELKPGQAGNFSAAAVAFAGPKIDTAAVAERIKGQKLGEAEEAAKQVPGVESAELKSSPSWATKVPGNTKRIKVTVKAANTGGQ